MHRDVEGTGMEQEQTAEYKPMSGQDEWPDAASRIGTNSFQEPSSSEGREVGKACLRASHLLRRSVHRQPGMSEPTRAVSLASCRLLDALSRALHEDPHCLPSPVAAAALRLSERIAELPPTPYLRSRTLARDAPR